MKIHLFSLLFFVAVQAHSQTIKNVLFIGNSYTSSNEMAQLTADIAHSLGDSLFFGVATINNGTLEMHTTNIQTLNFLDAYEWDHVVMQEQDQLPALSEEIFQADVVPYAEDLCQLARNSSPCVKPIFFLTWGRQNGDDENCASYPWVCTYDGQQDTLTSRYLELCEMNDAWCSPVGEVWRTTRDVTNDAVELYDADGHNPSKLGSYLTACTMYSVIFGETPEGADIPDFIDAEDGQLVQSIAGNTVLYTGQDWNLDPLVWADMQFEEDDIFWLVTMNTSLNVDSVWVDDGIDTTTWTNGETSAFTFNPGTHYFVLTVFSECGDLNFLDSLVIPTGVDELYYHRLRAFPNPCSEFIQFSTDDSGFYLLKLLDDRGQLVLSKRIRIEGGNYTLDTSALAPGRYQALVLKDGQWMQSAFIRR